MKIAIGNDHAAVEMKNESRRILKVRGMKLLILGQIHLQAVIMQIMEKLWEKQLHLEK